MTAADIASYGFWTLLVVSLWFGIAHALGGLP